MIDSRTDPHAALLLRGTLGVMYLAIAAPALTLQGDGKYALVSSKT